MNAPEMKEWALLGLHVMVTRPADPHDPLVELLRRLGARVVEQPAIHIGPPADWGPVDTALARLDEFDWLVFSSANGVRHLVDRMRNKGMPYFSATPSRASRFPVKIAAIGPGTADELTHCGLKADLVPAQFRAEALAEALLQKAPGRRFLLARASRGREVLAEMLTAAGAVVDQIAVYSSTNVEHPYPTVASLLADGKIDWITVTSSAIASSLVNLFGEDLRRAKLASISPITSGVLHELGFIPAAEAAEHTITGLVAAIVEATLNTARES